MPVAMARHVSTPERFMNLAMKVAVRLRNRYRADDSTAFISKDA